MLLSPKKLLIILRSSSGGNEAKDGAIVVDVDCMVPKKMWVNRNRMSPAKKVG